MKMSFCTIAFQKNKRAPDRKVERPLRQILPILAEAGYDGVEIWNDHLMTLPTDQREQIAEDLKSLDLKVAVISPYFDFTTSDRTAEKSMQQAGEVLAEARRFRADAIRVFTGRIGSAEATPAQWDRAVNCLQQLADQSAADGITWVCETHRNNLMDTVDSSLRLIQDVDRQNVCLIFQPTTFRDDWESALDLLGPYIAHVHANNYDENGKPASLEQGELDYKRILRALGRYSYEGYISVEWMGDNPEGTAHQEAMYLRDLLK